MVRWSVVGLLAVACLAGAVPLLVSGVRGLRRAAGLVRRGQWVDGRVVRAACQKLGTWDTELVYTAPDTGLPERRTVALSGPLTTGAVVRVLRDPARPDSPVKERAGPMLARALAKVVLGVLLLGGAVAVGWAGLAGVGLRTIGTWAVALGVYESFFLAFNTLMGVVAVSELRDGIVLRRRGVWTEGRVTVVREVLREGQTCWESTIEYAVPGQGVHHHFPGIERRRRATGDRVKILCDPERPDRLTLSSAASGVQAGVFGLVLVSFGLVCMWALFDSTLTHL